MPQAFTLADCQGKGIYQDLGAVMATAGRYAIPSRFEQSRSVGRYHTPQHSAGERPALGCQGHAWAFIIGMVFQALGLVCYLLIELQRRFWVSGFDKLIDCTAIKRNYQLGIA